MTEASLPPFAAMPFRTLEESFLTCGFVIPGTIGPLLVGIDSTYWAMAGFGSDESATAD